jgi:hypothetical protein
MGTYSLGSPSWEDVSFHGRLEWLDIVLSKEMGRKYERACFNVK